ncbi:hypothetical protein DLAC_02835 [Tieghemostelium lacteum]|uniref:Uncharacterized protein n=1 Tax=Tieghemostelium lacteum TaxID=361077 RepID=A0A152A3G7_TIELA|nr:hypothetical protein DLAC_02835 [Tieghemostelium lacteum]|eukprot:KYR00788.1 hypothetical protein DLAC_02835 [Tieghemostelium lacteum]
MLNLHRVQILCILQQVMVYQVSISPIGPDIEPIVVADQLSPIEYSIENFNPTNVDSGIYYFGICLNTQYLTTLCSTSLELQFDGYPYYFEMLNYGYYNGTN